MKILIVIDMQNDFITSSLANPMAQAIVKPIAEYIKEWDGAGIILTRDTHQEDYLESYEGKHLPVKHCIEGTEGWYVVGDIANANNVRHEKDKGWLSVQIDKPTFGHASKIADIIVDMIITKRERLDTLEFVGTVTEICVVSNVLGIKPYFPDTDFVVHKDLCAGLTPEGHEAALKVMEACQVKII